jgi:uncharacterized protein YtpQ (UPF0354 family)
MASGRRDVPADAMVRQEILQGLHVGYAVDGERTISYIPRKLFESWQMEVDDLHEVAIGNLEAKSQSLQAHADQEPSGETNLIIVQTLDGYDATRILLPGLHDRLREFLGSPFLVGIPNRDILICFRDDPAIVARVRVQVADSFRTMPHQVSDGLFLLTADGIAPYQEA